MDYAKNLLKKYGWKEGDGLGKNSDGICEPLKANLKFDTSGLGVDKASEFNNHWWERVFNEAANNLDVNKSKEENVKIATKGDSVEITTKEYSVKNLKKGHASYEHFVKKSVLNGLREDPNGTKSSEPDPDIPQLPKYTLLTDEELFAACGGRTAHKGARHGLKLSGKLSRIEEQERDLLQKMQEKVKCVDEDQGDWKLVTTKRKKRTVEIEDRSELDNILYTNEYFIKSKRKRKKQKKLDDELSSTINSVSIGVVSAKENNNKTLDIIDNRKKRCNTMLQTYEDGDENDIEIPTVRKEIGTVVKKKSKIVHAIENGRLSPSNFLKSNDLNLDVGQVSKKKKKKHKRYDEKIERELESSLCLSPQLE